MSALVPVQDAIVAALKASAGLTAALAPLPDDSRIYEGRAPEGTRLVKPDGVTPWPYVTIANPSEGPADRFGGAGYAGLFAVRGWVPGASPRDAGMLYWHIHRALHEVPLPLTDHEGSTGRTLTVIRCRVRLVTMQTDPDGGATQALAHVRYTTHDKTPLTTPVTPEGL